MSDTRQETCPRCGSKDKSVRLKYEGGYPQYPYHDCDDPWHTFPPQGAVPSNEIGDYSCAACGFGMALPCEHWKTILAEPAVPPVPAEPRSAEEFAKVDWPGAIGDSMYAKYTRQFAEAYAQPIREQLTTCAKERFEHYAALLSAQKEIQELRAKYEKKS